MGERYFKRSFRRARRTDGVVCVRESDDNVDDQRRITRAVAKMALHCNSIQQLRGEGATDRGPGRARRESESVDRDHRDRHHFSTYPKYAYAAVKTAQTGASQAPTPNAVATKYSIGKTFNAQNFFTCEAPPRTAVILPANQPS